MKNNLGTLVDISGSNLNRYLKGNLNLNLNTFQQSNEPEVLIANVVSASPNPIASQVASLQGVKNSKKTKEPRTEKKLSKDAIYEEIHLQINKQREGKRHTRMNTYLSLKTDNDTTFSVFLSGSVTSAAYETIAQANKNKEYSMVKKIEAYQEKFGNNCMFGRFRYKPLNGFKTDMHKNNIPHVLLVMYPVDGEFHITLNLLNEEFHFTMTQDVGENQKDFYDLVGIYRRELKVMNEEDAFE